MRRENFDPFRIGGVFKPDGHLIAPQFDDLSGQ